MAHRFFEANDHAATYSQCRPAYDSQVFETIISFLHNKVTSYPLSFDWQHLIPASKRDNLLALKPDKSGKLPLAVDVGCGTGNQSTYQLAKYFHKVVGFDVSPAMIDCAKKFNTYPEIDFKVSPAESLPVEDNSIYLVSVATALHWFDFPVFYKEVDRILKPGGVIAAYGYASDITVINHDNNELLTRLFKECRMETLNRGYWHDGNMRVLNKYTNEDMQIPYTDKSRVDGIKMTVASTIKACLNLLFSTSMMRRMFEKEPEYSQKWWDQMKQKLLDAYGADDGELSYTIDVYILLGRKPL